MHEIRPAKEFALRFGVKTVVYGGPGVGKTPLISTAPRPLLMITEPGMLSMRKSEIPTYAAFSIDKMKNFFEWLKLSNEAKNFDTIGIDSGSQLSERIVEERMSAGNKSGGEAHGLKVYGEMARMTMKWFNDLYFMPEKHIVIVTKLESKEINDVIYKRPYFPGKELPVRVPHLFDGVWQLGRFNIPGHGEQRALKTSETFDALGRDRSGNLAEYEPPDLTRVFAKCMA